jgi:cell wall-associated NlpC family hydrolase
MEGQQIQYFSNVIEAEAKRHAVEEFPKESCGIVFNGEYIRLENKSEEPEKHFKIDATDYVKYELLDGEIEAIVHSHTTDHPQPSKSDMEEQITLRVPWGIVVVHKKSKYSRIYWWGDELPKQPLVGRPFVYGAQDCYTLTRDFYWNEFDYKLPNVPREWAWWWKGQDVFVDEIPHDDLKLVEDLKVGDMLYFAIRADVANHCGVYLGSGLILHHLVDRLSRREPLGPWQKNLTHIWRLKDDKWKQLDKRHYQ